MSQNSFVRNPPKVTRMAKIMTIPSISTDPWRANFAWFWYNSDEIWHFTREDMDSKVKYYADQGITHLITFSCTHFRWSFKPWWKEINACLAKIVDSAHKHGLKVIEHHSSCLTYFPSSDGYGGHDDFLRNYLRTHKSRLEDWPGLMDYGLDENKEEAQWEQIDFVTGEKISTWYHGHIKCPNNPDYVIAYLKYLESVYATGIDGIMTDDMQFANQNIYPAHGPSINKLRSCGCKYCHALFREKYGYDLPSPEKWDAWFGSMDDPTYIDYLHFRHESCFNFHKRVKAQYESLGLQMLRPNYNSTPIQNNQRGTFPGVFPQLDWFFQECQLSQIIRYSWPRNLVEQKMISLYARQRNIPHMMLFYADRQDSLIFSFGIAKLAGAMYTNTPEGKNPVDETRIRNFENKYADFLFHTEEMPVVGFIDSEKNRFYSAGYCDSRLYFWLETVIFRNIPSTLYSISEPEKWEVPVLVANEVRLLSEREIRHLKKYAENGGTLVITGICGEQSDTASFRSSEEINALWGFSLYDESLADSWKIIPYGKGRICIVGYNFGYPGTKDENHLRFVYDERRRKHDYISPKQECNAISVSRLKLQNEDNEKKLPDSYILYSHNCVFFDRIAELLQLLAGKNLNFKAEVPDLVLSVPYYAATKNAVVIQLLNTMDTLPKVMGELISHDDPLPFPAWKGQTGRFRLKLPDDVLGQTAEFIGIEGDTLPLTVSRISDNWIQVEIPSGILKSYGMIHIQ